MTDADRVTSGTLHCSSRDTARCCSLILLQPRLNPHTPPPPPPTRPPAPLVLPWTWFILGLESTTPFGVVWAGIYTPPPPPPPHPHPHPPRSPTWYTSSAMSTSCSSRQKVSTSRMFW